MDEQATPQSPLAVDPFDGVLNYGRFAVGTFADGMLTLNLGWCRLAGLGLIVEGDPTVDRQRHGVVLRRVPGEGA